MIDLKAEYGKRYRITLDESAEIDGQTRADRLWLYQIACRRGHVYPHSRETLGAYCNKTPTIKRLIALSSVRVHQRGDRECTVTFRPEHLPEILPLLGPYVRRQVSEEERRRLVAMSAAHGFRRGHQLGREIDAPCDPEA